jgi:hypothetical protein
MEKDKELVTSPQAEILPKRPLELTEGDIQITQSNLKLLQKAVKDVLVEGEDYATHLFPGQRKPCLLDPGASKIRNFFNLYPEYTILEHIENEAMIRYLIQVVLKTRGTNMPVSSGIGSASSKEVKYGYRWVEDPSEYGITDTTNLKRDIKRRFNADSRKYEDVVLYRVENPDIQDLDNTLAKMAAKRAEVDAVLGLPGVAGIFTQDLRPPQGPQTPQPSETKAAPKVADVKVEESAKTAPKPAEEPEEHAEKASEADIKEVIDAYIKAKGWNKSKLTQDQKGEITKFFVDATGKPGKWTKPDIEKMKAELAISSPSTETAVDEIVNQL